MIAAIALAILLLAPLSALAGDLPDPVDTPGAINPKVTQDNIHQTICVQGWTKTVRPPAGLGGEETGRALSRRMAGPAEGPSGRPGRGCYRRRTRSCRP